MPEDFGDKRSSLLHKVFFGRHDDQQFQSAYQSHLEEYRQLTGIQSIAALDAFDRNRIKQLMENFPGGFRITGDFDSLYNCFGFILHHFYPDRFRYLEEERGDGFDKHSRGLIKFVKEYPVQQIDMLLKDPALTPERIIAFAEPTGGIVPRDNVTHVALIVTDGGRRGFESKLGSTHGETPRIVNYDLHDLVRGYMNREPFTHIQIYEARKDQ